MCPLVQALEAQEIAKMKAKHKQPKPGQSHAIKALVSPRLLTRAQQEAMLPPEIALAQIRAERVYWQAKVGDSACTHTVPWHSTLDTGRLEIDPPCITSIFPRNLSRSHVTIIKYIDTLARRWQACGAGLTPFATPKATQDGRPERSESARRRVRRRMWRLLVPRWAGRGCPPSSRAHARHIWEDSCLISL